MDTEQTSFKQTSFTGSEKEARAAGQEVLKSISEAPKEEAIKAAFGGAHQTHNVTSVPPVAAETSSMFAGVKNWTGAVKNNFTGTTYVNKGLRIVGGTVSAGLLYNGLQNVAQGAGFVGKFDKDGQQVAGDMSDIMVGVSKAAAGLGGLYLSLVKSYGSAPAR